MALAAGQEILDLVPLVVAQRVALHASASRWPTPDEPELKRFGNPGNDDLVLRRFGFSTGRGKRDSTQLTTRPSVPAPKRKKLRLVFSPRSPASTAGLGEASSACRLGHCCATLHRSRFASLQASVLTLRQSRHSPER